MQKYDEKKYDIRLENLYICKVVHYVKYNVIY